MLNQLLANGLLAGSIYALVAVGFALIYRVVRFFHFTHGLIYSLGAYQAYLFQECCSVGLPVSGLLSIIVAGVAGLLFNAMIFNPAKARGASALVAMLASLGLYTVGQNVISVVFGDGTLLIRGPHVEVGLEILGARVTLTQLIIIMCSWMAIVCVISLVWMTRLGSQIRAISDDPILALIVGVQTSRITAIAVALGSSLAGFAGFLAAVDQDIVPTMGMGALLIGVMAMIVGGNKSLLLVAASAVCISILQNVSLLWAPAAWKESIAFVVLLVFLLLRSRSLSGDISRTASKAS